MRVEVGDVERAIGPPRHRDRAEVLVRAGRQGFMPLRLVDRALRLELIPVRANVALAVIHDESTLHLLREVSVADELASGGDGAARSERQVVGARLLLRVDERCRDDIQRVILPGRGIEQDPAPPVIEDFAVGIPERVGHRDRPADARVECSERRRHRGPAVARAAFRFACGENIPWEK